MLNSRPDTARFLGVLTVISVLASSLILPVFGSLPSGSPSKPGATQSPPPLIEQHIDLFGVDPAIVTESQSALQASFAAETTDEHSVDFLPLAPVADSHAEHSASAHQVDQFTNLEPVVATRNTDTKPFTLVGVTSVEPFAAGTRVLVRVQEDSGWSSWTPLEISMDQPDGAEAENILYGTQPLLTNSATGVEATAVKLAMSLFASKCSTVFLSP